MRGSMPSWIYTTVNTWKQWPCSDNGFVPAKTKVSNDNTLTKDFINLLELSVILYADLWHYRS